MEGVPHPIPRTVEEVFSDFKARRAGLIRALTTGSYFLLRFSECIRFIYMQAHIYVRMNFLMYPTFSFFSAEVEKFYQQCDPGESYFHIYIYIYIYIYHSY